MALHAGKAQWTLDISIYHDPFWQHTISANVLTTRGGWQEVGTWHWKGLGVPEPILNDLQARVSAVITEHLVTRYGVQGELPTRWAGEPDPF